MSFRTQYLLAMLPAIVTVGGWQLAVWAYKYFGCQGSLKNLQSCFVGDADLLPFLGLGLFWCWLLMWLAVPGSFWLLIEVYGRQIRAKDATKKI
jgi:hypothetical protein